MASDVQICNRGLIKLGAGTIVSLTEDSRSARLCNAVYATVRDAEIAAHPWNFARKRVELAADLATPAFGYDYQYTLPADCLQILPPIDADVDWQIEGNVLLTNWGAPLELVYVARIEDPNLFHASFLEALACRMAIELCEPVTQSNTKLGNLDVMYSRAIREARRMNAFSRPSQEMPEDPWLAARR